MVKNKELRWQEIQQCCALASHVLSLTSTPHATCMLLIPVSRNPDHDHSDCVFISWKAEKSDLLASTFTSTPHSVHYKLQAINFLAERLSSLQFNSAAPALHNQGDDQQIGT